jgi:transcriptional regulator with XRE-family HTH domain
MDVNLLLGKKIQFIREKRKMSQDELSEKAGMNAKYLSAIECGRKNSTVKTLEKISKGLDVELFELFIFSNKLGTESTARKAVQSLIKDADVQALHICLDVLQRSMEKLSNRFSKG